MAAVGQRVAPTTTVRIEHLGQAITANGHVRTDHRRRTATPTVQNEKILGNRNGLRKPGSDGVDPRHRRRIVMQALQQRIHLLVTAADFEFDALRIAQPQHGMFGFGADEQLFAEQQEVPQRGEKALENRPESAGERTKFRVDKSLELAQGIGVHRRKLVWPRHHYWSPYIDIHRLRALRPRGFCG